MMLSIKPSTAAFSHPASLAGGLLALGALQLPTFGSWPAAGLFLLNIIVMWWLLHSGLSLLRQHCPTMLSEFAQHPQQDWWLCYLLLPVLAAWWLVADLSTPSANSRILPLVLQVVMVCLGSSFLLHALVQWPKESMQIQRGCDLLHRLVGGLSVLVLVLAIMAQLHSSVLPASLKAVAPISQHASATTACDFSEDDEGAIPCAATPPKVQSSTNNSGQTRSNHPQQFAGTALDLLSSLLNDTTLPYDASSLAIALVSLIKLLARLYLAGINGQTAPVNGTQLLSSLLRSHLLSKPKRNTRPNLEFSPPPRTAEPAPTAGLQQPLILAPTVAAAAAVLDDVLYQPGPSETAERESTAPIPAQSGVQNIGVPISGRHQADQPADVLQTAALNCNLTAANQKTLQQLHSLLTHPGALPVEMQQHQGLLQQLALLAEKP